MSFADDIVRTAAYYLCAPPRDVEVGAAADEQLMDF